MNIRMLIVLIFSHAAVGALGFAIGIYVLPILIAPTSPSVNEIEAMSLQADYTGEFKRGLKGSDAFHWGEGKVSISKNYVTLMGELAPGPDYKLYLSSGFVETEAEFEKLKPSMALIGDVKTFDNFLVELSPKINVSQFDTVVVWCETFGEFITSAKYR